MLALWRLNWLVITSGWGIRHNGLWILRDHLVWWRVRNVLPGHVWYHLWLGWWIPELWLGGLSRWSNDVALCHIRAVLIEIHLAVVILLQITPPFLLVEVGLDLHNTLIIIACNDLVNLIVRHVPASLVSFLGWNNMQVSIPNILKEKLAKAYRHQVLQGVLCILRAHKRQISGLWSHLWLKYIWNTSALVLGSQIAVDLTLQHLWGYKCRNAIKHNCGSGILWKL